LSNIESDDREAAAVAIDGTAALRGVLTRRGAAPVAEREPLNDEPRRRGVVVRVEVEDPRRAAVPLRVTRPPPSRTVSLVTTIGDDTA